MDHTRHEAHTRHEEQPGPVVVITGASSGVGRATALALATGGAGLVLVARSEAALQDVADECRRTGGHPVVVAADVADPDTHVHVGNVATEQFGRIDAWVNDAALLQAGDFLHDPVDETTAVLDTNIGGTFHGSRIALQHFLAQGSGTLVNVASLLAIVPSPALPAYATSKFAVRGLTTSLQHHYARTPGVHICLVLPSSIDTPMYQRAANHLGQRLRAIIPATSPERVAATVVSCLRRPRRVTTTGAAGWTMLVGHRIAPGLLERVVARLSWELLTRDEPADDDHGAVLEAAGPWAVSGGWRRVGVRARAGDAVGRALARHHARRLRRR